MQTEIGITIKDENGNVFNRSVMATDEMKMKCSKCGGEIFQDGFIMYRVSRLMIGAPNDVFPKMPIPFCVKCGAPLGESVSTNVATMQRKKTTIPFKRP